MPRAQQNLTCLGIVRLFLQEKHNMPLIIRNIIPAFLLVMRLEEPQTEGSISANAVNGGITQLGCLNGRMSDGPKAMPILRESSKSNIQRVFS